MEEHDGEKELVERELLIGYLKGKLGRYAAEGRSLSEKNKDLNEQIHLLQVNMQDIVDCLTTEGRSKDNRLSTLEAENVTLSSRMAKIRSEHNEELGKILGEKDGEIDRLREQIVEHEASLAALSEFQEKKGELDSKLEVALAEIDKLKRSKEESLSDLERKHVQELDKLRKENLNRIKETKQAMLKLTNNQLATTTKRTILENEQMASELSYQSRQTEKLLQKNQQLLDDTAAMRRAMDLSRQTEEELAKRNTVYQKTVKTLLTKQRTLEISRQDLELDVAHLRSNLTEVQLVSEENEESMRNVTAERDHLRSFTEAEAKAIRQRGERVDETIKFLLTCIEDMRTKIANDDGGGGVDGDVPSLEMLNMQQRESALQYLIERLFDHKSSEDNVSEKGGGKLRLPPIQPVKSVDSLYTGEMRSLAIDDSAMALPDRLASQVLAAATVANQVKKRRKRRKRRKEEAEEEEEEKQISTPYSSSSTTTTSSLLLCQRLGTAGSVGTTGSVKPMRSVGTQTQRCDPVLLGLPVPGVMPYQDLFSRNWGKRSKTLPLSQSESVLRRRK